MGVPQPRVAGLPRDLASTLAKGADSHHLTAASGAPPAQLRGSLFAVFPVGLGLSVSILCSLPSTGAQDSDRAFIPVNRGLPSFYFPLPDMIPPRFRMAQVGSGRPLSRFDFFAETSLDLGRWKRVLRDSATRRFRPSRPCFAGSNWWESWPLLRVRTPRLPH